MGKMKHPAAKPRRLAEVKKEHGNKLYKNKKYLRAIRFYSEAIALCPDTPEYYGNRCAAYMMLNQFKRALTDAQKCVSLDPMFVKGFLRIAKCSLALGDVEGAEKAIVNVQELDPDNPGIDPEARTIEVVRRFVDEADKAYDKGDHKMVIFCMDHVLRHVPCSRFKLRRAESLALLGRVPEALLIVEEVLKEDSQDKDAAFVRCLCHYYQSKVDLAITYLKILLKRCPENKRAQDILKKAKKLDRKRKEGNDAFRAGRYEEAFKMYSEALEVDPQNKGFNATLYCNRATVCCKLGRHYESVSDCNSALGLDENHLKSLLRRAKSYIELGDLENAIRDLRRATKQDSSLETKKLLQDTEKALVSKNRSFYSVLEVGEDASPDEIKKAYRRKALLHHPDRHVNASERMKKSQEKKFKEVLEAYAVLSDPAKRAVYNKRRLIDDDAVADEEDNDVEVDPTTLFHDFFGNRFSPDYEFSFESGDYGVDKTPSYEYGSFHGLNESLSYSDLSLGQDDLNCSGCKFSFWFG